MIFEPNSWIYITEITRGYKIFERDIDTWVSEGWFPPYVWRNGRRYWSSDVLNEFTAGSPVSFPDQSSIESRIGFVANQIVQGFTLSFATLFDLALN